MIKKIIGKWQFCISIRPSQECRDMYAFTFAIVKFHAFFDERPISRYLYTGFYIHNKIPMINFDLTF